MSSASIVNVTVLPTVPGAPLTPKSVRSMVALPEAPIRMCHAVIDRLRRSLYVGSVTCFVTPRMVRSPVTRSRSGPEDSTRVDLNVIVGNFWTSKK